MNTAHLVKSTLAAAICAASALATSATRAEAYAEEVFGKSGPFIIHRIFEGSEFNRCAATLKPGKNMLRIAYTFDHVYSISVPGVRKAKSLTMDFNDMESFSFPAKTDGKRTWAAWDEFAVNVLKNSQESINISVGGRDFSWNIGRTSMRQVLAAVEDCVAQSQ